MDKPKVSVIVPVYNVEKYLRRCIDSILAQTYTDFELLLVDDGSTDASGRICDEYAQKDSRIRVYHKKNGGVSSARNVGLDHIKGEWVTFCDADDWVFPEWLSNYNLTNSEEYDLICQGLQCDKPISVEEKATEPYNYSFDFEGSAAEVLNELFIHKIIGYTFNKIFRHKIIHKHNIEFDSNIKFQEDELFLYQYLIYTNIVSIYDRIGYFYHVPDWGNKYRLTFENSEYIHIRKIEQLKKLPTSKDSLLLRQERIYFTEFYVDAFSKNEKQKYCILQLRKLLKEDIKNTLIFYPTRLVLRYDKTGIFANLFLRFHLNLKNTCKRIKSMFSKRIMTNKNAK